MKILTRITETFADYLYRFRKRRLEDRIIRADLRGNKALCISLHCELSALNWARIYKLSGRKFKLTLVK